MKLTTRSWLYPLIGLPASFLAAYVFGGPLFMLPGALAIYECSKPDAGRLRRWTWLAKRRPIERVVGVGVVLVVIKYAYVFLFIGLGGGM